MDHINFKKKAIYIIFLIVSINLSLYAESNYLQSTKLTLNGNNVEIVKVLQSIEEKSEYVFFYSEEVGEILNKSVDLKIKSEKLDQILNQVLVNTNLGYVINDRQVLIYKKDQPVAKVLASSIKINGTVLDMQKVPLPGVNVTVKGTTIGTTTDIDGNYFLDVPDKKSILVFSYIGYETQEIEVGSQINISLEMKEISTGLNEVVVVGFGSQKKASVVGSITTIEPGKLQQTSSRGISNNLAGQLAGVIAVQRSGEPGKDGSQFWIRGISSFQSAGRSPLVLVDGIERSLDDMDAAEIESFSVLKDAAASAVYGVRGANGVILVNTKRGQIGKPNVYVNYQQTFTEPVKLPEYIGSADYLSLLNELMVDKGQQALYSEETIQKYRNGSDPELYPNVNWLKAITKDHGSNSKVNLTINGGSEILRYALVASYFGEHGIMERDKTKEWDSSSRINKYNVRSNVDINITKTTVARINIGGYLQEGNGNTENNGGTYLTTGSVFDAAFTTPPFVHPAQYSTGEIPVVAGGKNPWALATQLGISTSSESKIESLFSIEQDLSFWLKGLKIKGIFSFDRYSFSGLVRSKVPDYYNPATSRDENGNLNLTISSYGTQFLDTNQNTDWGNKRTYLEGNINYTNDFGKNHVDAMFMYNQSDYQNGDIVPYRRLGIAGRLSYMFDNKYIGEFNFGYNGSENFSKGHRFGFFPSFALGYLLSEEEFMSGTKDIFSKIKFRGSWGRVGNDQLSGRRFAYITTLDDGKSFSWGSGAEYYINGRTEGDFGVNNLKWETVDKTNIGVELGLFNALELQIDWFTEHRKDIFMQRQNIPLAAGFTKTPWANFGKVNNKGIDLSLTLNKQINKDWFVGARGTFTYAKNKIIEQDEAPGILGTNRSSTGKPVNQLFGLVAERLFTEDDFADVENNVLKDNIPNQTFSSVRPGDIKYVDVDGDGVITSMDQKAVGGTYDPQIIYGFGGNASYKNFDINIFFQGTGKTYRFIGGGTTLLPGSSMGAQDNIYTNYNDRWTVDNPKQDGFYPRLSYGTNMNNSQNSTWWLKNMSRLRLKDVELGYTIPKQVLRVVGFKTVRIYLKGSNLLTFSKFKLWDPDVNTANGAAYPIMKSISFGLDVNF